MITVAEGFAYALHNAGLADYRPSAAGGTVFADVKPDSPDECVTVDTLDAETEYGSDEDITTLRITVRGPREAWYETRAAANSLYSAVRVWNAARWVWGAVGADPADTVTVTGLWVEPPAVSRTDPAGRVEVLFRVRVSHTIGS